MNYAVRFVAIAAVFFYVLCWFADAPTKIIHYIGIVLPWLSMVLSIPIAYFCKVRDDNYFSAWGYVYVIATAVYFVVVSLVSGSIWHQLPHLAACICFIASYTLESFERKEEDLKKKLHNINLSSEKALEELRRFDDLYPKTIKLNRKLIDIMDESASK